MTTYSLTLQEPHFEALRAHLIRPDGLERAAYLLCGQARIERDPWDGEGHHKLVSYEPLPVPDQDLIESTRSAVAWSTNSFVQALKQAARHNQTVAIVHNHPNEARAFSPIDDDNEPDLWQLAANRNGPSAILPSLILTPDGKIIGRVWRTRQASEPARLLHVVGTNFRLQYPGRGEGMVPEAWDRQAMAFGKSLIQDLAHLRIGVVGCGGTGSAVAMLLARLGVGQLLLIDSDIVDRTNLNRLHGARQADADAMRPKVEVVKREITELGLGVRVAVFQKWVGDRACRDALRACDIIFGCTDDNDGRLYLNRFAYYYLVPLIDLGLAIRVKDTELPTVRPEIETLDGRVTVVAPGHTCLLCRGIIDTDAAWAEALKRSDPSEYERRKDEAYVQGEGDPNPSVITFTTEVATMAVNEMLQRLQGFRGAEGATAQRTRFFHRMQDIRPGDRPKEGCPFCYTSDRWGKGDVEPYLDRVG